MESVTNVGSTSIVGLFASGWDRMEMSWGRIALTELKPKRSKVSLIALFSKLGIYVVSYLRLGRLLLGVANGSKHMNEWMMDGGLGRYLIGEFDGDGD